MRPPFTYFGGKIGLAPLIVSLLPPHRVYVEPFFGSGAVLFAKPRATHEIINDVDGAVVNFFQVLRERPGDLEDVCRLTPYARAEYEAAADLDSPEIDPLERARLFWVRVNQSFGKTAGGGAGWSTTVARTQASSASVWSRISRFASCAERLMGVTIESRDACEVIERAARATDAIVYADPPYLVATRNGRGGATAVDYRHDMGGEQEHRDLAAALHATPATVLLSGYPSALYDDLYADWHRLDVPVTVHSNNSRTTPRRGRIETLWSNRPLHALTPPLFDHPT